MPQSEGTDQAQAFDLLARFVDSTGAPAQRPWLPTAGTLPQLGELWDGHPAAVTLICTLRSLGQVIFINNPISGLLLLALLWQSPAMGIFSVLMPRAEAAQRQQLHRLFEELDKDGNGSLSVAELAAGLIQRQPSNRADAASRQRFLLIKAILKRMDLDGDGRVNHAEFAELMLRLRALQEGRARLLTYLQPVDVDGNTELDPAELDRLLVSVGQPRLLEQERQQIFGTTGRGLSWGRFLDQLLLT